MVRRIGFPKLRTWGDAHCHKYRGGGGGNKTRGEFLSPRKLIPTAKRHRKRAQKDNAGEKRAGKIVMASKGCCNEVLT